MSTAMQATLPMRDRPGPELAPAGPAAVAKPVAAAVSAAPRSAFVPLLLGLLSLLVWLGHQAWLIELDRQQLQAARNAQAPTIETAGQLRRSLDLLAADTQRLADTGNPNAKLLVEELRKRGITINAAAGSGTASGAGR